MPRPPVLNPREVCRILVALGFVLMRQRGSHMHTGIPTDAARRSRIIRAGMCPLWFSGKSSRTSARRWMISWAIGEPRLPAGWGVGGLSSAFSIGATSATQIMWAVRFAVDW